MKISFIVPTFNEADVCKRLDRLVRFLKNFSYEIIVVDDSNEENFSLLDKYRTDENKYNFILVKGPKKGKGAAIKAGVEHVSGSIVFYMDSDLIIPLKYIYSFIDKIQDENYDIVIAERPINRAPRNVTRRLFSASLCLIQRIFIFNSTFFYDTQCGFKAFKTDIIKKITKKQIINPGMFDIEYLYIARKNELKIFKIRTIPLPEVRHSKVNFLSCMIHDPRDLIRIKVNGIQGKYALDV